MLYEDIRETLETYRNEANAQKMKAYMKDRFDFFGIKSPERRLISKEIFTVLSRSQNFDKELFKKLWDAPERELQYIAMEYLYRSRRYWDDTIMDSIYYALTHKSWWDTVDYLASTVVGHLWKSEPEKYTPVLRSWIKDPNMWLNRTAIISQLKYKDEVDTDFLAAAILKHSASPEFFHRKAIGWALRQYSKYNPEWVRDFLDQNQLSNLSIREASKYI